MQKDFFRKVDVGLATMQIVQVDQSFVFHRPIQAGDRLQASMEVKSVVERFGADIVVTRSVCTNEDGEVVLEAFHHVDGPRGRQLHLGQVGPGDAARSIRTAVAAD